MVVAVPNATTDQHHDLACQFAPIVCESTSLNGSTSKLPGAIWAQLGLLGAAGHGANDLTGAVHGVFGCFQRMKASHTRLASLPTHQLACQASQNAA